MEGFKAYWEKNKACLAVILVQTILAAMFLLSKAAFDGGMNNFVFVFYRQAIATIFLAPIAFFFEWKNAPPLSCFTFCKIFMLSLFGITLCLNLYGVALVYTSSTLAAATTNCLPVITFFLALILRMEVLRLKSTAGVAKVAGILLNIGGVAILAFYKGPQITYFIKHHLFSVNNHHQNSAPIPNNWLKGCFIMLSSNILWGLYLVLQALIIKNYPSKLILTTLQCLLSTFQSFAIAIAFERNPNEWKLGWNVRLLVVAYCGVVVTGVSYYLQSWVIEKKGPVFLAMSTPFALIITIFSSSTFLGETMSLGSILGGILLVGGLYFVLWGKSKEQKLSKGLKEVGNECTNLPMKEIIKLENGNSPPFVANV